eukprot:TRINITY_DN45387_c0_g1_i1.p1 TRINITY_DN45387_c0_g1~~TRINITY_DN45387_c0_g1_i1.p1  ORF type:complete len:338 (+),score=40.44 TRINITY_DN45387_c0_g1_i1:75-1088(+)
MATVAILDAVAASRHRCSLWAMRMQPFCSSVGCAGGAASYRGATARARGDRLFSNEAFTACTAVDDDRLLGESGLGSCVASCKVLDGPWWRPGLQSSLSHDCLSCGPTQSGAAAFAAMASVRQRQPCVGQAVRLQSSVSAFRTRLGQSRGFAAAAAAPKLSADASRALGNIKDSMKRTKPLQLSRAQARSLQGHLRRYKLMGGREEFHNIDRNKYGRVFEPWHNFEIVITSSKNNCWITVKNKGWKYRCVMASHAGNVGFRGANKKTEQATQRIALNIARKLKRLGVRCAEVTFRKLMKVETCLQAFQTVGLQVTKLTHQPRVSKGVPAKPRKMRRV